MAYIQHRARMGLCFFGGRRDSMGLCDGPQPTYPSRQIRKAQPQQPSPRSGPHAPSPRSRDALPLPATHTEPQVAFDFGEQPLRRPPQQPPPPASIGHRSLPSSVPRRRPRPPLPSPVPRGRIEPQGCAAPHRAPTKWAPPAATSQLSSLSAAAAAACSSSRVGPPPAPRGGAACWVVSV